MSFQFYHFTWLGVWSRHFSRTGVSTRLWQIDSMKKVEMEVTTRIAAAEGIVMSMSTSDQHFIEFYLFRFVFKVGSFQI
jgi:hypothetical protein